jgi:hypothetical protein
MPYLVNEQKQLLDAKGGDDISITLSALELKEFAGSLNYLIFRIVRDYIKHNGCRYFTCAVVVGTLICCVFEIYRRIVGKYEDQCIFRNGDVLDA